MDFWAYVPSIRKEFADSYLLGGHDLIRVLAARANSNEILMRRNLLSSTDENMAIHNRQTIGGQQIIIAAKETQKFFTLSIEAVARWIACVALEDINNDIIFDLMLLGMGWTLNPNYQNDNFTNLASALQTRVGELLEGTTKNVRINLNSCGIGIDRKTYLARNAPLNGGGITNLLEAPTPESFFGSKIFDYTSSSNRSVGVDWCEKTSSEISRTGVFSVASNETDLQPEPNIPMFTVSNATIGNLQNSLVMQLAPITGKSNAFNFVGPTPWAQIIEDLKHQL